MIEEENNSPFIGKTIIGRLFELGRLPDEKDLPETIQKVSNLMEEERIKLISKIEQLVKQVEDKYNIDTLNMDYNNLNFLVNLDTFKF